MNKKRPTRTRSIQRPLTREWASDHRERHTRSFTVSFDSPVRRRLNGQRLISARSGSSALYNSRLHLTDSESSRSERENRLDEEENHRRVEPYGSTRHLDGTPLNDSRRSKDRP